MTDETLTPAEERLLASVEREAASGFAEQDAPLAGDDLVLERMVDAGANATPVGPAPGASAPAAAVVVVAVLATGPGARDPKEPARAPAAIEAPLSAPPAPAEPSTAVAREDEVEHPEPRRTASTPRATTLATAEEMLVSANQARSEGAHRQARKRYRTLISSWPGTREALTGRMNLARLELEQLGKPRRALAQLEAYLREAPTGALAAEATFLQAQAHQRLGDTTGEQKALRQLLRQHPGSPHAAGARKRLDALDTE